MLFNHGDYHSAVSTKYPSDDRSGFSNNQKLLIPFRFKIFVSVIVAAVFHCFFLFFVSVFESTRSVMGDRQREKESQREREEAKIRRKKSDRVGLKMYPVSRG